MYRNISEFSLFHLLLSGFWCLVFILPIFHCPYRSHIPKSFPRSEVPLVACLLSRLAYFYQFRCPIAPGLVIFFCLCTKSSVALELLLRLYKFLHLSF
uniref:Uncharacterized protein n=1 Tax=Solanum lycopersicum TaxID=4081 RepID=A0A3Q7IA98_SOLLC